MQVSVTGFGGASPDLDASGLTVYSHERLVSGIHRKLIINGRPNGVA